MEAAGERVRILIADDEEDTRLLLGEALSEEPSVELVGAAGDTPGAVKMAQELQPDVVILDWAMPGGGGAKAAGDIKAQQPSVAVIALTGMDATSASYDMLKAGAVAFLAKGCSMEELMSAIRSATRW